MKIIKYMLFQGRINHGTEEEPKWEDIVIPKKVPCTADNLSANEEIAKKEAYNGYTIEDDGVSPYPIAPLNIYEGEYVMIGDVLYLATMNIPCGEPVIVGQNAVETTIEEQLYMLKGE